MQTYPTSVPPSRLDVRIPHSRAHMVAVVLQESGRSGQSKHPSAEGSHQSSDPMLSFSLSGPHHPRNLPNGVPVHRGRRLHMAHCWKPCSLFSNRIWYAYKYATVGNMHAIDDGCVLKPSSERVRLSSHRSPLARHAVFPLPSCGRCGYWRRTYGLCGPSRLCCCCC